MTSMTGYAYAEKTDEKIFVSVEIKSVNSRYLDIFVYLPSYLNSIESKIRNAVSEKISRGKVEISVRIKETDMDTNVTADVATAKAYADAIKKVAEAIGNDTSQIPLSLIVSQPGVLTFDKNYDAEKYWETISPIFNGAMETFCKDREREGKNLYNDLAEKIDTLEKCYSFFKEWQPKMEGTFKEQIHKKFEELLGAQMDEQRVMTETAAMLVKYTINEEIVRLKSHIAAVRDEMKNNRTPGKKIDFLCQEINREINTIGSKNQFAEVAAVVVTAKDAVENIREQARNVE